MHIVDHLSHWNCILYVYGIVLQVATLFTVSVTLTGCIVFMLGSAKMDELGLPLRMFEAGSEPSGRKRVNNYFNLRWIDIIKSALEEEDLEMLNQSQFWRVLQMGSHTF